jgi:hypothetical protein
MKEGFEKFSFGNELWTFEGLSEDKIEELGNQITQMNSTGQRVVTNVKGDIKLAVPQRTQSYDSWIESCRNEFLMALANPSLKLGLEEGFTKATAYTASDLFKYKVASVRRIVKRQIESLWSQILEKMGFDSEKANVKLMFASEDVTYTLTDVFSAVDKGIISKEEARTILKQFAKWRLEGDTNE